MKVFLLSALFLLTFQEAKAFDFVDAEIQEEVLHFTTVEEGDHYPFYIEQWINEEWVVVEEVFGKGGVDTNVYQIPLSTVFYGINKYRIKKETGWDYFSFSNSMTYFNSKDKVLPFVKNKHIIFSDTAFFKIVTNEGHIIKRGQKSRCELKSLERGKYIFMYNNRKKSLIVKRNKIILKDEL